MSRLVKSLFLLLLTMVFPYPGNSHSIRNLNGKLIATIENGAIRNSSSMKIGSVSENGEVRDRNSKKLGSIKDDRVMNSNSQTIFKFDPTTVRDRNGKLIYKIGSGNIRSSSGQLLLKYEDIELMEILAFLCFFYSDI